MKTSTQPTHNPPAVDSGHIFDFLLSKDNIFLAHQIGISFVFIHVRYFYLKHLYHP